MGGHNYTFLIVYGGFIVLAAPFLLWLAGKDGR